MLIKNDWFWLSLLAAAMAALYYFSKKRRLKNLKDVDDKEFIEYFQKHGDYTAGEIQEARKWASKIFRIPVSKVTPRLPFSVIKKATEWFGSYYLDWDMLYAELEKICRAKKMNFPKREFSNLDDVILFYLSTKRAG
jgi:hypothetical protein